MEYERKGVIINWQIKNAEYIYLQPMELYSPVITLDAMDGTKWKLVVHRIYTSYIWLSIKREEEDNGPEEFGLDYELSVKELHKSSDTVQKTHSFVFIKNQKCPVFCDYAATCRYTGKALGLDTPLDTLNIRCKIWRQQESIRKYQNFFAQTQMKTERCEFVGVVENFSELPFNETKTLKTVSTLTGEKLMIVSFHVEETYQLLKINLNPVDKPRGWYFKLEVFILDTYKNKTDFGKLEEKFTFGSPVKFTLPNVSKEILLKNACQYLGIDTLALHCELTFCPGKEYDNIELVEWNEIGIVTEGRQTDFSTAVEDKTTRHGIPCDTKIQTATETIPVHTTILSGQSPVFEAMFKSNMKETTEECVQIDDVDAKTVKRMLVFLYSDTLEEVEWKDAMKLYIAADKYQILPLKQKCTALLEKSLDLSTCCVLLHLADMHQDTSLKKYVQGYITENKSQILHCDQWRDLVQNLPHLEKETLSCIFPINLRRLGKYRNRYPSGVVKLTFSEKKFFENNNKKSS